MALPPPMSQVFERRQIEPEWSAYLIESLDDRIAADTMSKLIFLKKTLKTSVVEAVSF